MTRLFSYLDTAFNCLVVLVLTVFWMVVRVYEVVLLRWSAFSDSIAWTVQFWTEQWYSIPLVNWWINLPLGYSELHVPAEASIEEVARIIRTEFRHRLPADRDERELRIAVLLDQHCMWQRFSRCSDRRPTVPKRKPCRRCNPGTAPKRRSLTRGTHIPKRKPL